MDHFLLDTNIIIRRIVRDWWVHYNASKQIFSEIDAWLYCWVISPLVLGEVIYVLSWKLYSLQRKIVAATLLFLASQKNIIVLESDITLRSLQIYSKNNLDRVDCYLIAYTQWTHNIKWIKSFDNALLKAF